MPYPACFVQIFLPIYLHIRSPISLIPSQDPTPLSPPFISKASTRQSLVYPSYVPSKSKASVTCLVGYMQSFLSARAISAKLMFFLSTLATLPPSSWIVFYRRFLSSTNFFALILLEESTRSAYFSILLELSFLFLSFLSSSPGFFDEKFLTLRLGRKKIWLRTLVTISVVEGPTVFWEGITFSLFHRTVLAELILLIAQNF